MFSAPPPWGCKSTCQTQVKCGCATVNLKEEDKFFLDFPDGPLWTNFPCTIGMAEHQSYM
jgi:hypothetical protein